MPLADIQPERLDMRMALDPNADREDAIWFMPADRVQRNFRGEVTADYSTRPSTSITSSRRHGATSRASSRARTG